MVRINDIFIGYHQFIKFKMDYIFITNQPDEVVRAESAGIKRIMIDLEINGKLERQVGRDTHITNHSIDDIDVIRPLINSAELLVRVNPLGPDSFEEINHVIKSGADIVMLPMYRTINEVKDFLNIVDSRARTCLLLETKEALSNVDEVLHINGVDEVHVGLNDLHIEVGKKFMFEFLIDGVLENLSKKILNSKIKFGFGGVAHFGSGHLDSSLIISEHKRLGSTMVILSRAFRKKTVNLCDEISKINKFISNLTPKDLLHNKQKLNLEVQKIISDMQ